jgi:hypothetical protein
MISLGGKQPFFRHRRSVRRRSARHAAAELRDVVRYVADDTRMKQSTRARNNCLAGRENAPVGHTRVLYVMLYYNFACEE